LMMTFNRPWGALLAICAASFYCGAACAQDTALGRDLYSQHCAACHGANLEGAAKLIWMIWE
jgi:mono/diheme cytochrome c family protein